MVTFDTKTKRQILIFLLVLDGFYMLNIIAGFINTFSNLFAGVSLSMILGILNLYFGYLVYQGQL